jgi:hypothetical protein
MPATLVGRCGPDHQRSQAYERQQLLQKQYHQSGRKSSMNRRCFALPVAGWAGKSAALLLLESKIGQQFDSVLPACGRKHNVIYITS